ncbi:MAG: protein kinase [Planctomycetes bacterium]|nr:protein kinase [Planctomycetota bacterium]
MFGLNSITKIDKLYQDENWNGIIEAAENLFEDGTTNVKVLNDLAVAYKETGRNNDALRVCQKIYEIQPPTDLVKESINIGQRYMRHHLVFCELLYLKGEYEEALHILNQLKLLGSHFSDKFYILAKIYIKKNLYDKALDEYKNMFHLCRHRFDTALKGFIEIIELNPLNEDAYKSLYDAYKKKGTLDKAIAEYEAASQRENSQTKKYILGYLYYYAGRTKDSIAKFNDFISSMPNDTNIPFFLAHIYSENNDVERAIGIFQELIKKDPSKLQIVTSRLEKLLTQRLDDKQTECILVALIEFYKNANEITSVENILSKLSTLKPNNRIYQDKLEILLANAAEKYINEERLDCAHEKLRKLINLRPNNSSYAKHYKEVNRKIGEKRIQDLEDTLSKGCHPQDDANKMRYELANLYEESELLEKALASYNAITSLDPGYKDVAERIAAISKDLETKSVTSASEATLEDRYEDMQIIGQGSMGIVYMAVDKILKRKVALKVIKDEYRNNKDALERFIQDVQSVSLFKHSGFITIYDINVDKQFYIVMDYIAGEDLHHLIKKGTLQIKDAVQIAINVCDALNCAHQQGIIHRDIKPGNVLVMKDYKIKIADFGLAHLMSPSAITRALESSDTSYMSPEQIKGDTTDHRSDIYSFGIILYEMLTGKIPFENSIANLQSIEEAKPPSILNPKIPRWLDNIVLKCIKKKSEERYQETGYLLKEIKSYANFI